MKHTKIPFSKEQINQSIVLREITRKVCFVVSSAEDWITLWRVSGSQMQRLAVGLSTRVTE